MAERGYRLWVNCRCYTRGCVKYNCRFRLRKKPSLYIQAWRSQCPYCQHILKVAHYRDDGRELRANRCQCGGRPWSHRRTSPGCVHSKMFAAGFRYDDIGSDAYLHWQQTGRPADRKTGRPEDRQLSIQDSSPVYVHVEDY